MLATTDRLRAFKARLKRERELRALDQRGRSFGAHLPARGAPEVERERGDLERYFDGNLEGPGIWKWRHYFPAYERHLARFRGRPVTILEVGIYSGGSLGMWRDYLGNDAEVIGVDIEPACKVYEGDGVEVLIGDQADSGCWANFRCDHPKLDIVIDDGGHETHQQVATLEGLLSHINPGGVYICEDVHTEDNGFAHYISGFARNLHKHGGETSGFQRTVESVHVYPFLTVLEIAEKPREFFEAPQRGTQWQPICMPGAPEPTV